MNLDNYPTHQMQDPATGESHKYCAASKQWSHVDPTVADDKALHNAGEDRVYLLLKNKYTQEWEFPTTTMTQDQTFFRAKLNLFNQLTESKWRVKFFGSSP